MTIVEKAAYLKGLTVGLGVEPESRDGKLWAALNDLLADMAHEIEDLQAENLDMADALDEIGESLGALEEQAYALDCPEDFMDLGGDDWAEDEDEEEEEAGDDEEDEAEDGDEEDEEDDEEDASFETVLYDVVCPVCGEELTLDEELLAEGSIECPGCGETLEFDLQDGEES